MAEIIHDGFEWMQSTSAGVVIPKWDDGIPNFGNHLIPGRGNHTASGHYSSLGTIDLGWLDKAVASRTRIFAGGAVHASAITSTLGQQAVWCSVLNGSTVLLTVSIETDYSLGLRVGPNAYGGTPLIAQTAANTLSHGLTWEYFEFELVKHASAGIWRVWKDGILLNSFTGLNTGSDVITKFRLGAIDVPAGIFDHPTWINTTDFYLIDDVAGNGPVDRVGDSEMFVVFPNAAGAFSQFTPSAGANWENVDDRPNDGDSTTNISSTVGHKDRYNFENLPGGFDARVVSVTHGYALKKNDAGPRTATGTIRGVGGTEVADVSRALTTAYQGFAHTIWSDPDGSGLLLDNPDIVTIINGLQAGPEVLT